MTEYTVEGVTYPAIPCQQGYMVFVPGDKERLPRTFIFNRKGVFLDILAPGTTWGC